MVPDGVLFLLGFLLQLIIFMALANGISRVKTGPITLHTETAIHFAEKLTKVSTCVLLRSAVGHIFQIGSVQICGFGLHLPWSPRNLGS